MKKRNVFIFIPLLVFAIIICSPVVFLLSGSFMSGQEISAHISSVLNGSNGYATWSLIPHSPSFKSYIDLLIYSPDFYVMFWNSVKIAFFILLGQLFFAVPAAWGFARLKMRYKNVLFDLYIVLMLMPFQVTMLSNYLTLDKLNLINTLASVILPLIFSTFPVFIIYHFFRNIPETVIESAKIDGANNFQIFLKMGMPLGMSGVLSAAVLGFLEYWNLIEQPMTFLQSKTLWPLSLYLPNISLNEAGIAFAASVIILIPSILVFLAGQEYLEQGIIAMVSKE